VRVAHGNSLDHFVGAAGQGQRHGDAERNPIRDTPEGCARAASGQAAAALSSAMTSRRFN